MTTDTPESGSAATIRVDRVGLTRGNRAILSSFSHTFTAGQWHCVLGRSGIGKTSLLRMIAGLESLDSGRISDAAGRSLKGQCAYMAQDDGLLPWLTVIDNVWLGQRLRSGLRMRGGDVHARQRAAWLLESVGLHTARNQLPDTLSGGMRQRVALARTLFENRRIVLMDEPFSRLDAVMRDELQTLAFDRLAGCTVILVTHDPIESVRLGHTLGVLNPPGVHCSSQLHCQKPESAPLRDPRSVSNAPLVSELWQALRNCPVHDAPGVSTPCA